MRQKNERNCDSNNNPYQSFSVQKNATKNSNGIFPRTNGQTKESQGKLNRMNK